MTLYNAYLAEQTQLKPASLDGYRRVFLTLPAPADLSSKHFHKIAADLSPATLRQRLTVTRKFLRWWLEQSKTKAEKRMVELIIADLKTVKPRRLIESVTAEDLYTPEQLKKIFAICGDTRDSAMFQVLYESGCRAQELLSMTFDRVTFHSDNTATVIVDGKTGTRDVEICFSVPALRSWMNTHPVGKGSLWTSLYPPFAAIGYTGLYSHAGVIIQRAGLEVKKRRILHMFRHTRATELYNMGVRGILLQRVMGWTSSEMEKVYSHLSNADVKREMHVKVFRMEPEKIEPSQLLSVTKCPNCKTNNDPKSKFCTQCNLPLSNDAIIELFERGRESDRMRIRIDALEKVLIVIARHAGVSLEKIGLDLAPETPLSDGVPKSEQ